MKKVLVVLALCVPLAAMLAFTNDLGPMEHVELPVGMGTVSELALPDDTIPLIEDEGYIGVGFGMDAGDRICVKFTPPSYPFDLWLLGYYAIDWTDRENDWDAPCDLVIFADGERPGEEIGRGRAQAEDPTIVNLFDVSPLEITIESGSFYAGVENITDIDPSVGMDVDPPQHRLGWMYEDLGPGVQWFSFEELFWVIEGDTVFLADSLDPVIRAVGIVETGIVELTPDVVTSVSLASIVASGGTINYSIAEAGEVEITLWDALGRSVKTLHAGYADAGEHALAWDGSDLASGTYFIKLRTPYTVKTARFVLIH